MKVINRHQDMQIKIADLRLVNSLLIITTQVIQYK